ncbi:hypothetical protein NPIL_609011 [Nephila pilipes]|uniref:Uncharacterized protein n=1 Tax=Nephila pilipes TaxID=299642 RepID=A0A8X6Q323_NEPPI|nr:hypothetical protein NPIL_609011 [Nephila pilipes]
MFRVASTQARQRYCRLLVEYRVAIRETVAATKNKSPDAQARHRHTPWLLAATNARGRRCRDAFAHAGRQRRSGTHNGIWRENKAPARTPGAQPEVAPVPNAGPARSATQLVYLLPVGTALSRATCILLLCILVAKFCSERIENE